MISKKLLLAGVAAAGVFAMAGSAGAITLSANAGAVTQSSPYRLAKELNFTNGIASTQGQFVNQIVFNGATGLAPGTYTLTFALSSGATINTALPTATYSTTTGDAASATKPITVPAVGGTTFDGTNPTTLTLTSGGTVGSSSVTYTLQVQGTATVKEIDFTPALLLNAAAATGGVSFTASVTNQVTGQPVDPSAANVLLISTNTQGFAAALSGANSTTGVGGALRTSILTSGGKFNAIGGDLQIGQVNYEVANTVGQISTFTGAATPSPIAYKDLGGTKVSAADVVSEAVSVSGDFSVLGLSGYVNNTGAAAAGTYTAASTGVSFTTAPGASGPATNGNGVVYDVFTPGGTVPTLSPSAYGASAKLVLGAAFDSTKVAGVSGSFETIVSEGVSYVIPWVNSSNLAATSGSTNVIRISNIGPVLTSNGNSFTPAAGANPAVSNNTGAATPTMVGGKVYGILYNASNAANPNQNVKGAALLGTIGTSGELIITSSTLQSAFGDFGRGDVRLVVQTPSTGFVNGNIIVKRLVQGTNGGLTEIQVVPGDILTGGTTTTQSNDTAAPAIANVPAQQ